MIPVVRLVESVTRIPTLFRLVQRGGYGVGIEPDGWHTLNRRIDFGFGVL